MTVQARRGVLVTGASGVVGTALLPHLAPRTVYALAHRSPVPPGTRAVAGDVCAPRLGLDVATCAWLAARVDAVVHCAATTDFAVARPPDTTGPGYAPGPDLSVNVVGTREVLRFAEDAGAVVYHVSTAFVANAEASLAHGTATVRPEEYLTAKREADRLVLDGGGPAIIIRLPVVIGDSVTGEISRFQGLHTVNKVVMRGQLPLMPIPAAAPVDILPNDVVGRAIAALVHSGASAGEAWVTAGPAAPTNDRLVPIAVAAGIEAGLPARHPRLVGPEMIDRLIRPAFLDHLPPNERARFDDLINTAAVITDAPAFPTTLGVLPSDVPAPTTDELLLAYRASMRYLARSLTKRPVPA